jgi:hypothetical protein
MAKQFIQRHNGNTARESNRFSGETRNLVAKRAASDMRLRRQRLFDEAMMTGALDDTDVSLETACCITNEEPDGASATTCSDDGRLDVTILYSPEGRIQAALCRPTRHARRG